MEGSMPNSLTNVVIGRVCILLASAVSASGVADISAIRCSGVSKCSENAFNSKTVHNKHVHMLYIRALLYTNLHTNVFYDIIIFQVHIKVLYYHVHQGPHAVNVL